MTKTFVPSLPPSLPCLTRPATTTTGGREPGWDTIHLTPGRSFAAKEHLEERRESAERVGLGLGRACGVLLLLLLFSVLGWECVGVSVSVMPAE